MSFPTSVNQFLAPAVAGDFATTNPRASVIATQNALVAGTGGVTCAAFCWQTATASTGAYQSEGSSVLNVGSGVPTGYVARTQRALITQYLGETSYVIPQGFSVDVYNAGDFWARSTTATTIGQKVFASNTTGAIETGTAGATVSGYTETQFFAATNANANELFIMSSTPAH